MQLDLFNAHPKSGKELAKADKAAKPLKPLAPLPQVITPPPYIPPPDKPTRGDMVAEKTRLSAQSKTILEMLQRGRVRNADLQEIAFNYTARISELRGKGHKIRCVDRDRKTGLSWYELLPGNPANPANSSESSA